MKENIQKIFNFFGYQISKKHKKSDRVYVDIYRKYQNYTMIFSEWYIENLKLCERFNSIQGDVVECGVWKGGMIAGIAEILKETNRTYFLLDSFEGLPEIKFIDGAENVLWQQIPECHNCKAEISFAEEAMELSKAENYQIIKGWFNNTLPSFKTKNNIAILRLDGDLFESTMQCLDYLYPQVVKNGLIIIDDYYFWEGASKAVHQYLNKVNSKSRIYSISDSIAYIIKNE